MGTVRRQIRRRYKWIMWLLLIVGAWLVLESDWFLNGLMSFVFAGVIPGTDKTLAPEVVVKTLVVGAAGILALIVLIALVRHISFRRWLRTHKDELSAVDADPAAGVVDGTEQSLASEVAPDVLTDVAIDEAPEGVEKKDKKPEVIVRIKQTRRRSIDANMVLRAIFHLGSWLSIGGLALARGVEVIFKLLVRAGMGLIGLLGALFGVVLRGARLVLRAMRRGLVWLKVALHRVWRGVVAGWTSVRPLIVSVDSWIESHVKQIASKGGSQVAKHDDVMFAAELSRQVVVRPMATLRENVKKTKANSKSKKTPKKRRAASRKKR